VKKTLDWMLVGLGVLSTVGCGSEDVETLSQSYCEQVFECFPEEQSVTDCREETLAEHRDYEGEGCGEEFRTLLECAESMSLDCSRDLDDALNEECNAELGALAVCEEDANAGNDAETMPVNEDDRAAVPHD
jgi:hypothetical protein